MKEFIDPTSNGTPSLTEDEIFSILSNQRRRFVLHALRRPEADTRDADIGWLAEQIAAWENGIDVDELSSAQRKSAYTALQQTHLPKMDEVGVVAFDRDRGTVEATPAVAELDIYLEVVDSDDIPWHGYYLGLGTLGVALLAALWVDAVPFDALPDLAWVTVLVTALLVSAGIHAWTARERRLESRDRPPELEG